MPAPEDSGAAMDQEPLQHPPVASEQSTTDSVAEGQDVTGSAGQQSGSTEPTSMESMGDEALCKQSS